jgi:hypothetical protein
VDVGLEVVRHSVSFGWTDPSPQKRALFGQLIEVLGTRERMARSGRDPISEPTYMC